MTQEEIELTPTTNADSEEEVREQITSEIFKLYDVYSYRHAAGILKTSFPDELSEIEHALLKFRITKKDIALPGGRESAIPKLFSEQLRPHNWKETQIQGDLVIRVFEKTDQKEELVLKNYIDGHKIDYVKGSVALDLEWNSKDQTYDRDLYAFRMFHECGVISAAVIITRSEKLNPVFDKIPLLKKDGSIDCEKDGTQRLCKEKYGASTTWMGKLLYRLNAGRNGGCPVLVFGIRPEVISDLGKY